jgi:SAM-dependent methyltransferase
MNSDKASLQESQYDFPYHFVPGINERHPRIACLKWGLEYLAYSALIKSIINQTSPQSMLDIGCGDGRLLTDLSNIPIRIGCDVSTRAMAMGAAMTREVEFRPLHEIGNRKFDCVSAIEVLEHVPDLDEVPFLRMAYSHVSQGGRLIVSVPSIIRPVHKKHYRHYSRETLHERIYKSLGTRVEITMYDVYKPKSLIEFYIRATCNRHWVMSISWIEKLILKRLISAGATQPGTGAHLVAVVHTPQQ